MNSEPNQIQDELRPAKIKRFYVFASAIGVLALLTLHFWPHIRYGSSYVEIFRQPTGPYAKATVLYGWSKSFVAYEAIIAREHHPFEKPADPIELSDLPWCKHGEIELLSASAFLFNTLAFLTECACLVLIIYTIKSKQLSLASLAIFISLTSIIIALWTQYYDVGIQAYDHGLDMRIYWFDEYFEK